MATLTDLIKTSTQGSIESLVYDHQYKTLDDFTAEHRQYLYEIIIEKLYNQALFAEIFMIDDLLLGILSNIYTKDIRKEVVERISDMCDETFEGMITESYKETFSTEYEPDMDMVNEARAINKENNSTY